MANLSNDASLTTRQCRGTGSENWASRRLEHRVWMIEEATRLCRLVTTEHSACWVDNDWATFAECRCPCEVSFDALPLTCSSCRQANEGIVDRSKYVKVSSCSTLPSRRFLGKGHCTLSIEKGCTRCKAKTPSPQPPPHARLIFSYRKRYASLSSSTPRNRGTLRSQVKICLST